MRPAHNHLPTYKHISGCTLPGGYTYELDPGIPQRLLTDLNTIMVDDTTEHNGSYQVTECVFCPKAGFSSLGIVMVVSDDTEVVSGCLPQAGCQSA